MQYFSEFDKFILNIQTCINAHYILRKSLLNFVFNDLYNFIY